MQCPCQSGSSLQECCGLIIRGEKQAQTAEQLMRARYTAYTQVEMEFIEQTHDPKTRAEIDMAASREWAETTKWTGLEIVKTQQGNVADEFGMVEFKATFDTESGPQVHHELSLFNKQDGRWFYSDSTQPKGQTVVRGNPKIGRNDPCACGSGKKFKKCCGAG